MLHAPFAPAVVISHPADDLTAYLQERPDKFPGFKVEGEATRSYPQGAFGSEFLGLLGQIQPAQVKSHAYKCGQPGEVVGQSGVEAAYDSVLNACFLQAKVRVDSLGRIAGVLRVPRAEAAADAAALDRHAPPAGGAARARLRNGTGTADGPPPDGGIGGGDRSLDGRDQGARRAIRPSTRSCAADNPRYYNGVLHNTYSTPGLNRAIAGVYPTGSTFKPIISEAALSGGIITPSTPQLCSGSFTLGDHTFFNVERGAYESMTLPTALEQSCDTWFYRLGARIWDADPARKATLIQSWARKLGLGTRPPIDLTGAFSGYLPVPGKYFEQLAGTPYTEGQAVNLAIGQGALQVSPLQLAVAYSALINGGTVVRPHVGEAVIRDGVRHVLPFKPVRRRQALAVHLGDQAGPVRGCEQPGAGRRARSSADFQPRSPARRAPPRRPRAPIRTTTPGTPPGLPTTIRSSSSW